MAKRSSKIVSFFLAVVFVFSLLPGLKVNADVSGTCGAQGDNLNWTLDNNGTLTISGSGDMANYAYGGIAPWFGICDNITSIEISQGVTSIGNWSFYLCMNVTSVTIPNTVTSIGEYAFYFCEKLNNVTLPASVNTIGEGAFESCSALSNITINGTITSLGDDAFSFTALTDIPGGLITSTIPNGTFTECKFTTITIPNTVTSIGMDAFKDCTNLTEVTMTQILYDSIDSSKVFTGINPTINKLPSGYCGDPNDNDGKNVIWVYDDSTKTLTISGTGAMADYHLIVDSSIGAYRMNYPWYEQRNSIKNVVIEDGVTSIGEYSFIDFEKLNSVTISNSVTEIGYSAFSSCSDLPSVDLPDNLVAIGSYAFDKCFSLQSIEFPDTLTTIGSNAFSDCPALSNITINGTITSLGESAFSDTGLTDIPGGLITSTIPYGTFSGCKFTTITIPNTVTSIETNAFADCSYLTSVTIPNSVTSIGAHAFGDCTKLTSVTIPGSVESIGADVFANSNMLKSITIDYDTWYNNLDVFSKFSPDCFTYTYGIKFVNEDGTVLQSGDVEKNVIPDYTGATPTKAATAQYTYTFSGWTPTIDLVTGDATYTATYTATTNEYTIDFVNEDNSVLESSSVPYGDTPVCTITPTKAADAQYTYTFSGWTPTIAPVTGDATYTATYSTTTNEYTVTFIGADGNQLQSGKVAYGKTPVYSGATPTKDADSQYTYTFSGWSPEITTVTGNATYAAVFTKTAKPTPAPSTPAPTPDPASEELLPAVTSGIAHVQDVGNVTTYADEETGLLYLGTEGQGKRLESITLNFENPTSYSGTLEYRVHVQDIGWTDWVTAGNPAGTEGQSKRIEAIEIRLTGELAENYTVIYGVHIQDYGDMQGFVQDGALAGTTGESKRIEALTVIIAPKGAVDDISVCYRVHVQDYGWEKSYASNGEMAGTSGESKRLEGIEIYLTSCPYSGGIQYKTHVQDYGWESSWTKSGEMSGTQGQSKRLEGICIELYGEVAEYYDIYYRVHAQDIGWMAWAKNGECAGTAGRSARLEGIQIVLVPKGDPAPGATYEGITAVTDVAFIEGF